MIPSMKKIVVIGSPGAGKTTFARELGCLLKVKVRHLDRYFWEPQWREKPREVRKLIQHDLLHKSSWIIEGTYLDSSDERLQAADTIIFLDVPRLFCLWRVIKRRIKFHRKSRPDLPKGCTEKLRFLYLLKVLVFPHRGRKLFLQKLSQIGSNQLDREKQRTFYWLKSNKDIETFLRGQAVPYQVQSAFIENKQRLVLFSSVATSASSILSSVWKSLCGMGESMGFPGLYTIPEEGMPNYDSNLNAMR